MSMGEKPLIWDEAVRRRWAKHKAKETEEEDPRALRGD